MKQSLLIVIEQIRYGLFSSVEVIEIVKAITKYLESIYPESESKVGNLLVSLKNACDKWDAG